MRQSRKTDGLKTVRGQLSKLGILFRNNSRRPSAASIDSRQYLINYRWSSTRLPFCRADSNFRKIYYVDICNTRNFDDFRFPLKQGKPKSES